MSFRIPSTPNARSIRTAQSTTPAGPPPSHLTNPSTTPAGPPPRSLFGSSVNPSDHTFPTKSGTYAFSDEADSKEDAEGEDEDYMDEAPLPPASFQESYMSSAPPNESRGLKRSRNVAIGNNEEKATKMRKILQGQVWNKKPAKLNEPDNVTAGTERILADLTEKVQRRPVEAAGYLTESSAHLTGLWSQHSSPATKSGSIGPKSNDPLSHANYIASLLLQLHHPHTHAPGKAQPRNRFATTLKPSYSIPLPKALLDWLNTYHMPFPDDYDSIRLFDPSPAAHEAFWDVVYANALRGRLDRVVDLLQNAGWDYACTAQDDDPDEEVDGYSGYYLAATEDAAAICVEVLQACPGLQMNDWDIKGMSWSHFRSRVHLALDSLHELAGMDPANLGESTFQRSTAGRDMSASTASRQANSRIPWTIYENLKLLYGLLRGEYSGIMMVAQDWLEASLALTIWWDGADETGANPGLAGSGLIVRKSNPQKPRSVDISPLDAYRRKLRESWLAVTAEDDPAFSLLEQKKDKAGNAISMDDKTIIEAAVNTSEPVLTALACILANESPGGIVDLLQSYSQPVAVAVVELGSLGRWLPLFRPRLNGELSNEFSRDNLLAFSVGRREKGGEVIDRDEILVEYAERLAEKPRVDDKEGWELAVAVLNRLDQTADGQARILDLLETLELADEERVDNILVVCDQFNLVEQRRAVAERFADSLAAENKDYGAAIIYYARAHAMEKLKGTIVFLTSLCLLHSASFPAEKLLDQKLAALLSKDRQALKELARTDMEAANALASHLSGYATLRRFYDLRDQDTYILQGSVIDKPLKSLERRRQAASALFAVIKSAADCITGGLYDPEIESVVPSEGLLALFGEALPLLGQEQRIFTEAQVFALLTVIEDFVASPSRIRENADSLLSASLSAYKEGASTASGILKKSRSDLSASSSWEMIASQSMMAQSQSLGKNAKIQRAWDWRQGLVGMGGADADSAAVIKLVREGLIREVAAGWGGKLNW